MRHIYLSCYVLILLWFLRMTLRELFPAPDMKPLALYLNLDKQQRSIKLATSLSLVRLQQLKKSLVNNAWIEEYMHITDGEPKYEPLDVFDNKIFTIYSKAHAAELRHTVQSEFPDKYIVRKM